MNRLKELRNEKRLSLRALADKVDINYTSLSRVENGTRSLDKYDIEVLCKFFGVSADYLLGLSEHRNTTPKQQLSESQVQILSGIDNLTEDQAQSVVNYINFLKTQKLWKDEN